MGPRRYRVPRRTHRRVRGGRQRSRHPECRSPRLLTGRDRIAERLRGFAVHTRGQSPLYGRLAVALADDPLALDILEAAPVGQPPANLILGAIQYLLLADPDQPLAGHYPSVASNRRPAGDPVALVHGFIADHRDRLTGLVATRTVQTNEVRRCTTLLPAFAATGVPEPLALIEVGASAGLNLLFDRYRYDYGTVSAGPEASPLTLTSEIRSGSPPIPGRLPAVGWRLGIDLHPIDLADPDAVRWARALIWPEQIERVVRFETAVTMAREDPPPLWAGDALALLPEAIAEAPSDASVVVSHSFVLNQWAAGERRQLGEVLAGAGRRVDRISVEMLIPGQDHPVIEHIRYDDGTATTRRLGTAHHHGAWVAWEA